MEKLGRGFIEILTSFSPSPQAGRGLGGVGFFLLIRTRPLNNRLR